MLSDVTLDLPVRPVLPALVAALDAAGAGVLVAPPGTGKTTLAPLAVADRVTGRVVIAQPRRVAARAAARRMAELLGERVGERVGYAVRGERRVGPATRIEVVTTGLLVRRLHHDPELPGTGAVLLDECHERQLDADLALAFTVEARATLRPDLWLLAMSATPDTDRFAALLGGPAPAPVVRADSALHPVQRIWVPPARPIAPPGAGPVDRALLDHVAATVRRALREHDGDVLVFLPGAGEIAAVTGRLADLRDAVALLPLHGRQRGAEQDAALRRADRRRVVLATALAETSLTVPGRADRGGRRAVPGAPDRPGPWAGRAGHRAGLPGRRHPAGRPGRPGGPRVRLPLLVGGDPRAAARPGRAGDRHRRPDRLRAGAGRLGRPGRRRARAARRAAGRRDDGGPGHAGTTLGAVDADGRITARGRAIAAAGAHPRLARALLDGAGRVGADRAAEVVALLAEESAAGPGDDLVAGWRRLRAGVDAGATARWRTEVRRLRAALPDRRPGEGPRRRRRPRAGSGGLSDDLAAGLLVGLAYPERLARVRRPGGSAYLMTGGTAAELAAGSGLAGSDWLAVAVADRTPGAPSARIRRASPVDEATAREAAGPLLRTRREVGWSDGDVVAREVTRLGAIELVRAAAGPAGPGGGGRGAADRPAPGGAGAAALDAGGRGRCASGSRSSGTTWARRGRTSATRRCSTPRRPGWARSWPPPGAAPTWRGWTWRRRCAGCCPGRRPPASTSWPRSGSRCRAVPGSGWTTATRPRRCSR